MKVVLNDKEIREAITEYLEKRSVKSSGDQILFDSERDIKTNYFKVTATVWNIELPAPKDGPYR